MMILANSVSEKDYCLCKNRLTKFVRSSANNPAENKEERMGHVCMLLRKKDIVCCKWAHVNDEKERDKNKECCWMNWEVTAANWIVHALPNCALEGFVHGSLMEQCVTKVCNLIV